MVKEQTNECKELLEKRAQVIEDKGYQSKERIIADEEIKNMFDKCEEDIADMRTIFKAYQFKNKRKVEQSEIENWSRSIDLLRKNLNLL